jgi:hypothetical protein
MSYSLRPLALAILLAASATSAWAVPGATVPWTTYEAENMTINGGLILGPPITNASLVSSVINMVQMEASGGEAVELSSTGQYVQLTAQAAANSLVVRYCVPDTANGSGTNYTLSLYQNGVFVQELPVTSQYSWRYGAYPFYNIPSDGSPRNFFDEVRLMGLTINPGDTIRLEKGSADTSAFYIIDLVDLENVASALSAPANSLSITNSTYGAVADGVTDCTTAIQSCINAGASQGKIVWMPPGNYLVSGTLNLPSGAIVQGAGMWYTTLVGNAALYNTTPSRRVTLNGEGNNIQLNDFAITGFLNYRNDNEPNDGLGGSYGTGSSISRLWVEHTKTGAWIVNSSGLVVNSCRFRDTIADGCNIDVGMRGTIVTNCTCRGTGDDCFGIWPATYTSQTYTPGFNVITHCFADVPNLANGGAIYGGVSNTIEDCAFSDIPYGCGLLIAGTFAVGPNIFSGITTAQRCNLNRCGGYDPGWEWRGAVTLCPQLTNISGLNLNHLNISNSLSYAVQIVSPGSSSISGVLSSSTMNLVNISNYGTQVQSNNPPTQTDGVFGVWARSDAYGSLTVSGLTVNGTAITGIPATGSALANQSSGSPQDFAFNFLPEPTLTKVVSGSLLKLSWPANYIGWTLEAQTNMDSGAIGTNWVALPGSTATNQYSTSMGGPAGSVFYRLNDQ